MTSQEALQALEEGKKLSHRFFGKDEWMVQNDNRSYEFEDGA